MKLYLPLFLILAFFGWSLTGPQHNANENKTDSSTTPLTYLALGDSYTIGESVAEDERWPVQLAMQLTKAGIAIEQPKICAKTGWRTDQLLAAAKRELGSQKFDVVSLLIGVNNEFQGEAPADFEAKFTTCLSYAIQHCNKGKAGVFVLSIPDYGFTPFGEPNQKQISQRLAAYNTICQRVSKNTGVAFYDITPVSQLGLQQPNLVASDGLHPSGEHYQLWVKTYQPLIEAQIRNLK